jgi:hypothetical protein
MKTKTFVEIYQEERFKIPTTVRVAKRIQQFSSNLSVPFELDRNSIALLEANLPFKCNYTLLKKMAENIIISSREKHRKTDKSRLDLMEREFYHYRNSSFYYLG